MSKKTIYPEEFMPSEETKDNLMKIRGNGTFSVCFFNNKGGVGKTTLAANLASELSLNHSARVLVVDADPQCNLTQYCLSDDEFLDTYSSGEAVDTIYDIIHPISQGKGYLNELPTRKAKNFGFDIIVGDPRIALKEDLLAQDWRDAKSGGVRGLKTTFVFEDLLSKTKDYDLVFFDVGPSLGAINRAILIAADGFVVPMAIDIFSLWALRNIGTALRIWNKELKMGLSMAEDPKEFIDYKQSSLKFIGYVTQQHKERSKEGSVRIVEAYEAINRQLPTAVKENLYDLYDKNKIQAHLGDIKHLNSLAPKSQTLHSPMITLRAVGSYTTQRKQAREIFSSISARFLENIAKSL
ncbi:ParA family protein [Dickeya dadantii]|uniref:Phage-related regulatory protein cII n=1 Tax=Dickeya dadantii (strain 3937) TaxID=198628 RepID=E0SEA7_DICD3|nr:AAA family ATPase [Dickeya dadantii]ADM98730.1 Phage-related regulatory protein cII [Dickeya dadantii 3937]UAY94625.1 AAA family ATPase [Dickeya dadantii]